MAKLGARWQMSDSSSTDLERDSGDEEIGQLEQNPWKILEFGNISHLEGTRQHPSDVQRHFRRLSRVNHPDKEQDEAEHTHQSGQNAAVIKGQVNDPSHRC